MDNDNREESGLSTSDGISGVQNNNQNIRADWHHYEENVNNQDGSNQTGRGQYDQQIADIVDEHNKERKYGSRFYRKGLLTGIIATFSAMVLIVLSVADVCLKKGYLHIGINGDVYIQSDAVTDESGIGSEVEAKLNAIDSVLDSFYFEEVDDEKAKDSIYKAYLSSYGDKYTVYYTADEYKKLTETTNGTFSGIGAVCQISSEGGILLVDVYESGAGYKAGLRSGDRIIQVDGTDVTDMDLSSAVALVKGEKGTQVGLKIVRDGATSDYTVVRDEIEVQTVNYAITEDNIGYISVSQFENVTAKQFKAAKEQAETIVNAAQIRTEELINEHEIMQRAYAQANALIEQATAQAQQILDSATEDANSIRQGAMDYTDDMLEKLQYIIERSIRDNREKYDSLLAGLNNMLSIVNNNRNELKTPVEEEESTPEKKTDEPETSEEAPVLEDVTEEEATDILE